MSDDRWNRVNFYLTQTQMEQSLFWNRFVAFSALNAGLLAFFVSNPSSNVGIYGLVLSIIWVFVSHKSSADTKRVKQPYHKARRDLELFFENEMPLGQEPQLKRHSYFTTLNAGVLVAYGVSIFWLFSIKIIQDLLFWLCNYQWCP